MGVENTNTGVVLNEDFPKTTAPSWDGAPKAGVSVADVDGDAVFALAPKALTVGGLGFTNAEVLNVLLPNADAPESNVEEPNADVDLRFASTPKPLEGATILRGLPSGLESGVLATHPMDIDSETDMAEDDLGAMGGGDSVDALGSVLILSVLDSSLT